MKPTNLFRRSLLLQLSAFATLALAAAPAKAGAYLQTDLVSDIAGLATITDPNLKNPWGVALSATRRCRLSDQATNVSTLYTVSANAVSQNARIVAIPTTASGPQGPTGQVFNSTTAFVVGTAPASFIFANLNGTISAWNASQGSTAAIVATTAGAVYTGLAIDPSTQQLYAANNSQGRIDVFNGSFAPVSLGPSAFIDPSLPAGLAPFNVQEINGQIYVTYAPAGQAAQSSASAGTGAVAIFNTSGTFVSQLISGSNLASPWGIAMAPSGFGAFGGDLLVGNFSFDDSEINAFNPTTGALLGTIPINVGPEQPGGLWALDFGNGGSGGSVNTLYITDGINAEADGLFAAITPVPEPASLFLFGAAIAAGAVGYRHRRAS